MTTTLGEKTVTARKPHECQLCHRTIDKGEKYFTQRNADGGEIWTWRAHLACNAAIGRYLGWADLPPWWLEEEPIDPYEFREFLDSHG